ncbi:hypothetical protein ACK8OR_07530 [Jannaschia sp. KMU-145]|uniref:hypothetical protein n=1 Tax=Jannaschia halovivens TaxID=3388667 RepID=UPI00396B1D91
MRHMIPTTAAAAALALAGCVSQESSEATLAAHGYSAAYVAGYHDGCPSGRRAGGDSFSQRVRDAGAYGSGGDYRTGWDYGFLECRDRERQAEATARLIGSAIATGIGRDHGADGVNAREILAGIDTSGLDTLGQ